MINDESFLTKYFYKGTTTEGTTTTNGPKTTTTTGPGDYQRTVIFMYAETQPGNDLFYNGGINHQHRGNV